MDPLYAAGELVLALTAVLAGAAIVGIAVVVTLEDAARLRAWARRRRHRHAHPVTRAAKARTAGVPCRCPDGPCRVHPFVFDYERLLVPRGLGKPW